MRRGNYPRPEIDRIKAEISVQRLVEATGIKLQRHGQHWKGLCPFHDDHEPSLIVTPSKNVWHCMGACQKKGGDVIEWVMQTRGVSFPHAVELLKAEHPSLGAKLDHVVRKGTAAAVKLGAPFEMCADDKEVLGQVVDYYHRTLKQSPEAQKYLESRGLMHSEMIDHFKIGFANRTLGYRLPDKNRKSGAELRGRLERIGIFRAETGHEHFNGAIVIPVFDLSGAVVEMYGRKITRVLTKGLAYHLYLPGPHRGVWNEEALVASKEIILCEALIDALTFWCAGFRNVTASYGVNGFTKDHREAFQKHGVKDVWIAYDRDEAGDRGAEQLRHELSKMGIGSRRVLFGKGMDANAFALKVTPASKSLAVLLNSAEWWEKSTPASKKSAIQQELTAAKGESEIPSSSAIEALPEAGHALDSEPPVVVEPIEIVSEEKPIEPSQAPVTPQTIEVPQPVIPLAAEPVLEVHGDEITMWQEDRRYRVRGLAKNTSHDVLRVNVLVARQEDFHVDTFDLNMDRPRVAFIKRAAEELNLKEDIITKDVGRLFLALEQRQAAAIRKALEPGKPEMVMSPEERAAALAFLKDPKLLDRILADYERAGLVGEETNKLVAYVAAVSRHLETPLAVMVQSSSASGKSSLMDATLAFVPEEERIQYSAMTGQSLYYMTETDLRHKVLAVVEGEGASRASYALKLLQSEGSLSIASTGKDALTGKLVTQEYRVEGPVMIFTTTTAMDVDEELLNRCFVLSVNEDRAQTQAVHRLQREQQTLEGMLGQERRRDILRLHQNAQRLLRPVRVVNSYAKRLTFPDGLLRTRRDHMKYLTLIRAIAFLHQHQRPLKTASLGLKRLEYIEVIPEDIAVANRLVSEVLGRSLDDLRPETRRMLLAIDELVTKESQKQKIERSDFRFSRRQVREYTGWSATQVRIHMERLHEMEYLVTHRGGRGQSFVYELVFEPGANGSKPQLPGLIHVYDANLTDLQANLTDFESQLTGSKRPQNGGVTAGWRSAETQASRGSKADFAQKPQKRTSRDVPQKNVVTTNSGGD
jgi:DNA primase catalytic core